MHPVLFSVFGYPVHAYGFFMSLAHFTGVGLLLWAARRHHQPLAPFLDLLFAVIFAGLVGARLDYAFHHWEEFRGSPAELAWVGRGGLSFFGGFPPAFLAFLAVLRWRRLPILPTADFVSPILPFTLGLVRLGCFLEGCCYGLPTSLPWGITYTRLDSRVPRALLDQPLHPTQLYEVIFLFALSAVLLGALRRRALPPGVVATFCVFAYALYRFLGDFLRADIARGPQGLAWLGPTQTAAALGLLATPLVLWICFRARVRGQ